MMVNNGSFNMIDFISIEHAVKIVTLVLYKFKKNECDFMLDKIKVIINIIIFFSINIFYIYELVTVEGFSFIFLLV